MMFLFWLNYKVHSLTLPKIQFGPSNFTFISSDFQFCSIQSSFCQNCAINFQLYSVQNYIVLGSLMAQF